MPEFTLRLLVAALVAAVPVLAGAALDRGMTGFFTDHPDVGRQTCSARN